MIKTGFCFLFQAITDYFFNITLGKNKSFLFFRELSHYLILLYGKSSLLL